MNQTEQLLASLRDIHEPAAPEGVSPWLVGANLLLLLIVILAMLARRHRRREQWRRQALRQIARARTLPPPSALLHYASTLRQLMLSRLTDTSQESGEPWLRQLDTAFATDWFSRGEGKVFGNELYTRKGAEVDTQRLGIRLQQLIRQLPGKTHQYPAGRHRQHRDIGSEGHLQ